MTGQYNTGEEARRDVYSKQYEQGYEFRTNAFENFTRGKVEDLESEGLQVFVGDRGFGRGGYELPLVKTILVRRSKGKTGETQ